MVTPHYEVVWNTTAKKQLRGIYNYIRHDSLQNAEKVAYEIITLADKLGNNPERFGLDKYKKYNDGSYRYFELFRCRIAFRIYKTNVRILSVRSTDQEPLEY